MNTENGGEMENGSGAGRANNEARTSGGRSLPIALVVVLVLLVAIGGWWWSRSGSAVPAAMGDMSAAVQASSTTGSEAGSAATTTAPSSSGQAPMSATITYGPNGFSPANVTVAEGGTVTWVNESGTDMWVASDPHPLHDGYDGTPRSQHCAANYTGPAPFDSCKVTQSNDSFSFVFTKTGSWGYHDHFQEDNGGTVTVVAH